MKKILLFLLALLSAMAIVLGLRFLELHLKKPVPFIATPGYFHFQPPLSSKSLMVIEATGEANKFSLDATQSALTTVGDQVLQGENLSTGVIGKLAVELPSFFVSTMSAASSLTFVSTNTDSLMGKQDAGIISYQVIGPSSFSLRTLHFLVELQSGSMLVSLNSKTNTARVKLVDGVGQVAFEDLKYNSQLIPLPVGKILLLNDARKSATLTR